MVDLSVEQGTRGIANLSHHLYAQESISKLIHLSIQASQLESARFEDIMMCPQIHIPSLLPHG